MIGRAIMTTAVGRRSGALRLPMAMTLGRIIRMLSLSIALSVVPASVGLLSGCWGSCDPNSQEGDSGPTATTVDPVQVQDLCSPLETKLIKVSERNFTIELDLPQGVKIKEGAEPIFLDPPGRSPIRLNGGKAQIVNQSVVGEFTATSSGTVDIAFAVEIAPGDSDSKRFVYTGARIEVTLPRRRGKGNSQTGKTKTTKNLGLLGEL